MTKLKTLCEWMTERGLEPSVLAESSGLDRKIVEAQQKSLPQAGQVPAIGVCRGCPRLPLIIQSPSTLSIRSR